MPRSCRSQDLRNEQENGNAIDVALNGGLRYFQREMAGETPPYFTAEQGRIRLVFVPLKLLGTPSIGGFGEIFWSLINTIPLPVPGGEAAGQNGFLQF